MDDKDKRISKVKNALVSNTFTFNKEDVETFEQLIVQKYSASAAVSAATSDVWTYFGPLNAVSNA